MADLADRIAAYIADERAKKHRRIMADRVAHAVKAPDAAVLAILRQTPGIRALRPHFYCICGTSISVPDDAEEAIVCDGCCREDVYPADYEHVYDFVIEGDSHG